MGSKPVGIKYKRTEDFKIIKEKATQTEIEEARLKAFQIIDNDEFDRISLRSCWVCNLAHAHLVNRELLKCFECSHLYYYGLDLTEIPDGK